MCVYCDGVCIHRVNMKILAQCKRSVFARIPQLSDLFIFGLVGKCVQPHIMGGSYREQVRNHTHTHTHEGVGGVAALAVFQWAWLGHTCGFVMFLFVWFDDFR